MYYIRLEVTHKFYACKYGFGKESKSLPIVIITVKSASLEIILIVNQIISYPVNLGFEKTAVLIAPSQINVNIADINHIIF